MFEQFQFVGRKLFEEGLVTSHGGSISVKEGNKIIITRRESMLSDLSDKDLVEISLDGEFDTNASADAAVHRIIYANSAASAVVHAQPPYAVSLSFQEEKIIPQDADGKSTLRAIPVIRVRDLNSTDEIIRFLAPQFKSGYSGCLVRGQGSYAAGAGLLNAYKYTSILEYSCKIIIISKGSAAPQAKKEERKTQFRSAIPPSIGVMDRSYRDRGKR